MIQKIEIRQIDDVVDFLQTIYYREDFRGTSFNSISVRANILKLLANPRALCLVYIDDDKIKGVCIAVQIASPLNHEDISIIEIAWHADLSLPKEDRWEIMERLHLRLILWAKDEGVNNIRLSIPYYRPKVKKYLEKNNYIEAETTYILEVR